MMNLFRKKESKKSEFEIEEDDEEKGEYTNYFMGNVGAND